MLNMLSAAPEETTYQKPAIPIRLMAKLTGTPTNITMISTTILRMPIVIVSILYLELLVTFIALINSIISIRINGIQDKTMA